MFKFQLKYFIVAALLFLVEVYIAVFVNDNFIRPYFGDFLVVIFIYCFVKSFLNTPVKATAIGVLVFSYVIEVLQYFKFVKLLGLQKSKLASVILGTSFAWTDILAYTFGIILVLILERAPRSKIRKTPV